MIYALLNLTVGSLEAQTDLLNPDAMRLNDDKVMACALSDPEFDKRKSELLNQVLSEVKKVTSLEDGYAFFFEDDEDLLSNLFHYIQAEKRCCPFFRQEVVIEADAQGITWTLGGGKAVKAILSEIIQDLDLPEVN